VDAEIPPSDFPWNKVGSFNDVNGYVETDLSTVLPFSLLSSSFSLLSLLLLLFLLLLFWWY
jgi:hypothetical protein